jgi:hypothetical protein
LSAFRFTDFRPPVP